MPRFYLQYEDEDRAPATRPWTVWRVFLWTLLLASMALWMGSTLSH
jgi:hypothetical protein